ncbi:transcriptional regulator with XRE-family HTH domain [Kutzneria viridogrisea]|uniref:Transcriptional regulator with XRE-family HTH domain n=1 Tax=Kutzneria viridogrisea TaxID=47990 RepID=A0ABR6BRD3_9PSEU|nr:transcriptional regulator with XRE-family HTH domain [Kutzneria viridogrisea]
MARDPIPALVRKSIGGQMLVDLREARGLRQNVVADTLGFSQPQMTQWETGQYVPSATNLEKWLDYLEAAPAKRDKINEHFALAGEPLPKGHLARRFKGDLRKVVILEGAAPVSFVKAGMWLPWIVQTPAYLEEGFRRWRPKQSEAEITKGIRDRVARQKILENDDQHFVLVIDQASLARMPQSKVTEDQLRHLMELSQRKNVELQFVPFTAGTYAGQELDYWIFEYTDPSEETTVHVAYLDRYNSLSLLHGSRSEELRKTWEEQLKVALPPEEASSFLSFLSGIRPL